MLQDVTIVIVSSRDSLPGRAARAVVAVHARVVCVQVGHLEIGLFVTTLNSIQFIFSSIQHTVNSFLELVVIFVDGE